MDHQRISQQALQWQVPGYKRGPGRPRANWRSTGNKDLQKMGFIWKEAEVAALDKHGWRRTVGVWPNVSSWMRVPHPTRHSIHTVFMLISHRASCATVLQ